MVHGEVVDPGCRDDRGRVVVLWKLLRRSPAVLVVQGADDVSEIRSGLDEVLAEVRDEARVDDRTVRVCDGRAGDDVVGLATVREDRERGSEEEVADPAGVVVARDFGEYRKRRIVHDDAPGRVVVALEVLARPERADGGALVESVLLRRPFQHCLVDVRGRVAVVCRLLRLELFDECLVVLARLLKCALYHCFTSSQTSLFLTSLSTSLFTPSAITSAML